MCCSGSYTEGCFFPTRPRGSPRAAQRAPDESRPSRRTFEELLKTCRQDTLQAHFGCPGHRAVRSRSCSKPCLDTSFQEMLGNPPKPAQNHPGMPDSSPPGKRAPSQHTVVILLSPRGLKPAQNHPGMPETSPPRGTPHRGIPS